jgi:hypothetical protein
MVLNTILHHSNSTPNPYNLGKYAIYSAPLYEQNYYSVVNHQIQTQYVSITLSIIDSVVSAENTLTFLFSLLIPILSSYPIEFLGIYDSRTNIIEFKGDTYYGTIHFVSNKNAYFTLKTGNGFQQFQSTLNKFN